jgi:protein YibB
MLPTTLPSTIFSAADLPRGGTDSVTVVTAFFDIGRDSWSGSIDGRLARSVSQYLEYFSMLARLRNSMIIFTEPHLGDTVLKMRHGLEDRTVIHTIEGLFDLPEIRRLVEVISTRMNDTLRRFVWRPLSPEYNDPRYVLVNALKSTFVCSAKISDPNAAWLDFGYVRDPATFDPEIEWRFDPHGKINLFRFLKDDRPIFDIVREGIVCFQGCHIVGPTATWPHFNARLGKALEALLDCGLVDDDQTLLGMAWRAAPDEFIAHDVRIDGPLGWRFIFRKFHSGAPEWKPPMRERKKKSPAWAREIEAALKRVRKKRF